MPTDAAWPMTDCSYLPAGALQRSERTRGRGFHFSDRTFSQNKQTSGRLSGGGGVFQHQIAALQSYDTERSSTFGNKAQVTGNRPLPVCFMLSIQRTKHQPW